MFYGVTYCHGCDRPGTAEDLRAEEWLSVEGHWFCPACQESIERCDICGEPNWLDHEWHNEGDSGTICPDCREIMKNERFN